MKTALAFVPPKNRGGFATLFDDLEKGDWTGAQFTVKEKTSETDIVPDLAVIAMGSPRSGPWGIGRLMQLVKTTVPAFIIMTDAEGVASCKAAGIPELLGDRLRFLVVKGIPVGTPVGWPGDVKVVRLLDSPTDTDSVLVSGAIRSIIGPPRPVVTAELDKRTRVAS